MLQQPEADDYVIATGQSHSIEDFLDAAFSTVGLDWHRYVVQDERYRRPAEVTRLVGDPTKASRRLGWVAQVGLPELAALMVRSDLELMSIESKNANR